MRTYIEPCPKEACEAGRSDDTGGVPTSQTYDLCKGDSEKLEDNKNKLKGKEKMKSQKEKCITDGRVHKPTFNVTGDTNIT